MRNSKNRGFSFAFWPFCSRTNCLLVTGNGVSRCHWSKLKLLGDTVGVWTTENGMLNQIDHTHCFCSMTCIVRGMLFFWWETPDFTSNVPELDLALFPSRYKILVIQQLAWQLTSISLFFVWTDLHLLQIILGVVCTLELHKTCIYEWEHFLFNNTEESGCLSEVFSLDWMVSVPPLVDLALFLDVVKRTGENKVSTIQCPCRLDISVIAFTEKFGRREARISEGESSTLSHRWNVTSAKSGAAVVITAAFKSDCSGTLWAERGYLLFCSASPQGITKRSGKNSLFNSTVLWGGKEKEQLWNSK